MYITNKLGIPITENNYIIDGHSIVKYITTYNRLFRSIKTYTAKVYGIHLYKRYKHEKK